MSQVLASTDLRIPLSPCARDGKPGEYVFNGGRHEIRCTRCPAVAWGPTEIEARFRWNDAIKQLTAHDNTHPFVFLKHRADPRPCCKDLAKNLDSPEWIAPDKVRVVCNVCGMKHTKMFAERGVMGLARG